MYLNSRETIVGRLNEEKNSVTGNRDLIERLKINS